VSFSVTNIATIGKAIINLLSSSDRLEATVNKHVFILSHIVTQNKLFDAVRKATPGEEWSVEHLDSKTELAKAKNEISKGNFHAGHELIKYVVFAEGLGDFRKVASNDLLGLEKEDLDADVKKVVLEEVKCS
jgi:hypothetical protein